MAPAGTYIEANGLKIYYETYGEGEPLLLVHGRTATPDPGHRTFRPSPSTSAFSRSSASCSARSRILVEPWPRLAACSAPEAPSVSTSTSARPGSSSCRSRSSTSRSCPRSSDPTSSGSRSVLWRERLLGCRRGGHGME
jgi:hypothetical protein